MGEKVGQVTSHHEVGPGRHHRIGGKRKSDAGSELPAAYVHGAGALVIKFNVLVVIVVGNRVIHDLVDHNVPSQNVAVRCVGRPRGHRIPIRRAIRIAPERDVHRLRLIQHRVQNSRTVRVPEIKSASSRVRRKARRALVKGNKPV